MIGHASCGHSRMYVRQAGTPLEVCILLLTQVAQNALGRPTRFWHFPSLAKQYWSFSSVHFKRVREKK